MSLDPATLRYVARWHDDAIRIWLAITETAEPDVARLNRERIDCHKFVRRRLRCWATEIERAAARAEKARKL